MQGERELITKSELMNMFEFKRNDLTAEKYAVCKVCDDCRVIKMTHSNTSGLHRHVSRYHNKVYSKVYNKAVQDGTYDEVNFCFKNQNFN